MPPGGPEDRRPPVVIATDPEPLGVLTDLDAAVTFRFDERISERVSSGTLATAFTISPRSGDIRASKGARSLEVRPEGGFRPGLVYRVTLQAVVSDLFGNMMTDPFELVFTTGGGEPVPTTLAGEVWDRVTGRAVTDAVVLAESPDGLTHLARSDRQGIYAFRYLPAGDFTVTAFEDRNRDGIADSTEVQGVTDVALAVGDTLLVDVPILEPDTAAANVTEAEALDSVTVVVTFDDYLPPDADPSDWPVLVTVTDTTPAGVGVEAPGVERVFQEAGYVEFFEMVVDSFAVLDSLDAAEAERQQRIAAQAAARDTAPAGDSAAVGREPTVAPGDTGVAPVDSTLAPGDTGVAPVDSTLAPGDTTVTPAVAPADTARIGAVGMPTQQAPPTRVPPTELRPLQGESPGPTQDGRRVLPGRRIVVVLDEPLAYDVVYEVEVSGVPNIGGLTGGGGEAEVVLERPPPPDTTGAAADSAGVPPDTSGAPPDTGSAPPDTGSVWTATGIVLLDTDAARPETGAAPPGIGPGQPEARRMPPDTCSPQPGTGGAPSARPTAR